MVPSGIWDHWQGCHWHMDLGEYNSIYWQVYVSDISINSQRRISYGHKYLPQWQYRSLTSLPPLVAVEIFYIIWMTAGSTCMHQGHQKNFLWQGGSQIAMWSPMTALHTYLLTSIWLLASTWTLEFIRFSSSKKDHNHHQSLYQQWEQWIPSWLLVTAWSTNINIASGYR